MAWNTPRTWTVGELLTAANMNTYVSNNLTYLKSMVAAEIELFGVGLWPSLTTGAAGVVRAEMTTNKDYIGGMNFASGSQTYAEGTLAALPDDYGGGTITAKFMWAANSASGNSVIWGLAAVAWGDNVALDAAFGTPQETTDANNGAYKLNQSAATTGITIAGTPAAGQACQFRAYRKGTGGDNLAVAALLLGIAITYTRT